MKKPFERLRRFLLEVLDIHPACTLSGERFYQELGHQLLYVPRIFGDRGRLKIGQGVVLNDALINTSSGSVTLHDYVFFGHGVCLLTGTHDYQQTNLQRQVSVPQSGRNIAVGEGAWLGSNVTVLGPCSIGEHAVVAAGAVVIGDVPARSVYGGVPARHIKDIKLTAP